MVDYPVWSRGERATVTGSLAKAVAQYGERVFLDFGEELHTYTQFDHESTRLARGLAELGIAKGDCVGTVLDNNVEAVLAWFAINKLGAISVPVNTAYKGEFLRHQLDDCGAEGLIAEADYAQRIIDIEDGLPHATTLLQRAGDPVKSSRMT